MKYIRPKSELTFYIILLLLNILFSIIFWTIAYLDYINMINNGYVNKDAITFELNKTNQEFKKSNDPFILFQFNPSAPEVKYVWVNGDVKLPPIKENKQSENSNPKKKIAIIGENFNSSSVPSEYNIILHFNTPNSYKLNSEIWLISNKFDIDLKNGNYFIINSPNSKTQAVLNKIINKDSIEVKDTENSGSYALSSNKLLNISLQISILFITIVFVIASIIWISKEKI